ncbi:MAG: flagellar hook-basal body complex protein [Pseudomonadales bacterium]|nr:flagellar hook-basal body complex protein [Pseudomonadales bacterium]NRA17351.1 flagellar hook-basal body complex protein [Oceanospirillaceae bacterium]
MAGFNTAISGIRAATTALDVTGNNIANASTTGFKSSRTEFADIYATAAIGSGASNVPGSGVLVSDIAQDFSGGNVQHTNNNLDLSINGSGFFQLDDGRGSVTYTRDGSFELDKDGFIVSKNGANLQGFGVDETGNRLPIGDLQVSQKESPPKATETMSLSFNINEASDSLALIVPYSRLESGSHTFSTTVGTFDSLGNEHSIRYDMVEQQPRKEVHTFDYDDTAGDTFTISGQALDSVADFTAGKIDAAPLLLLQAADPRILDVDFDSAAVPNTIKVTFKADSSEYGSLVNTDVLGVLTNETITYIDSNEQQYFNMTTNLFTGPVQFKIAGVAFNLDGTAPNLSSQEVADAVIAKETEIRDSNPNIESITFDPAANAPNGQLKITFKADSGDVNDTSALVEEIVGNFFAPGAPVTPDAVTQGDNSFQGVYRMYGYLNPLGQSPESLDLGKLADPSSNPSPPTEIAPILIKFNPSNGILTSINGNVVPTGVGATVPKIIIRNADPADPSTTITLDIAGTTQFADEQIVKAQGQDGYGKGDLTGVSFTGTGDMVATFSNNQSVTLGIVAVATFENQAGLQPSGNTQWQATFVSGEPVLNPPGSGLNGSLRSSALESSNVDLSAELVALIEAQRNFQASSKTLETLNTVTQNILQI